MNGENNDKAGPKDLMCRNKVDLSEQLKNFSVIEKVDMANVNPVK